MGSKEKLGFLTADDHGADDTLCRAIAEELDSWNPVNNRLRCLGRIINLAVQAFLFARNEEAVAEAERQPQRCKTDIDLEIAAGSIKEDGRGWSTILPLQKLHTLTSRLDRSDKLKLQFGKLAKGRTIHADNETRWNSWYFTIDSALKLQFEIGQFVHDNYKELGDLDVTHSEWQILRDTLSFLQPFKEATKRCEGRQHNAGCSARDDGFPDKSFRRADGSSPLKQALCRVYHGWPVHLGQVLQRREHTRPRYYYIPTKEKHICKLYGSVVGSSRACAVLKTYGRGNTDMRRLIRPHLRLAVLRGTVTLAS